MPTLSHSSVEGGGPRPVTSRRTLAKGFAWSVPVVAAALPAPAFAASCSTLYTGTTNWSDGTYTAASTTSSSGGFTASNGQRVGIGFASTFTNYAPQTSGTITNLGVVNPVGGTGGAGITMLQAANSAAASGSSANNQTVAVTFTNGPVRNLSFLLTDIDVNANQFVDAVAITGTTFTSSVPTGSTVTGAGTTASPFRQAGTATVNADTATGVEGNVRVTIPGPVTGFNIVYWNALANPTATNRIQGVWIANMTGSVLNPGC